MADRPTIAELRRVTQPEAVRGRRNAEHWTADVYLRRLSPYLTRLLLPTPLTPNGVTGIMIATGAAAGAALLLPGLPGAVLAALLGQLQMLWDCCDGELARWRQSYSPAGVFLDKVGHYTAESAVPLALGVRADGGLGSIGGWTTLGALLALLVIYNKALNDMVHVARAFAGLGRLEDRAGVGDPRSSALRRLRRLARAVPFHRAYHSVELTLLALAAAVADVVLGDLTGTRVLVAVLVPAAALTVVGHVAAILSSSRLR
ncbi:MAG: CDP-alcohol phosphatidyltransferase family protein [Actinomycetota bacterium]|nr:CDP-alcohol phosphatidyltransferase family protein [Actinomycetota bacterium]